MDGAGGGARGGWVGRGRRPAPAFYTLLGGEGVEMVIASPPRSSHFCFMRLTSLRDHPPGPGTSSNKPCGRIDGWIMHGFGLSLVVSLPAVKIGRSGWRLDWSGGLAAQGFDWSARARPHRSLARPVAQNHQCHFLVASLS
jgi:hypothetical protein